MQIDFLVVGSGLTGAVIARNLHDAGYRVLVVDRRSHEGGNVHDHFHSSGIRIHTYGPHYFRTSSEKIWSFVHRFGSFYRYEAELRSLVDGVYEQWPISAEYLKRVAGDGWKPAFQGSPSNFEEASLGMMPISIYEKFVRGYTEKQWGVPAASLSVSLAGRFEISADGDPRLKRSKFQGIPRGGYAGFMQSMLRGIPLLLNFDYLKNRCAFQPAAMTIYTGPIDEFFDYRLGKLSYRGQLREHRYLEDVEFALPKGQVNYPLVEHGPHIRKLEWKHMMEPEYRDKIRGTVVTTETPCSPADSQSFEYPFPDASNQARYQEYRALASELSDILICGRLGEYRYFDMDQAIGRAMTISSRIEAQCRTKRLCVEIERSTESVRTLQHALLEPEDSANGKAPFDAQK